MLVYSIQIYSSIHTNLVKFELRTFNRIEAIRI